jgi:hypothetical protein
MTYTIARKRGDNGEINKLYPEDRPVHEWYRFVLSFPPHLVRDYITRFGLEGRHRVLDPFCGTGTVLVECKKQGIASVGIEANPVVNFASRVKVDWDLDPDGFLEHARFIFREAVRELRVQGIEDNPLFPTLTQSPETLRVLAPEMQELLLTDSISPLPLHKILVLLDCLERNPDERYHRHELLALARTLVYSASNLQFGPEVGVGPAKLDAPVISAWMSNIQAMANDLRLVRGNNNVAAEVHLADSRDILRILQPQSIDAVITSPPYPNEKDYTRTTRLEAVLLGFLQNKADLQELKRTLLRSNTRTVYQGDSDDLWVAANLDIQNIARAIEARRKELNKTSGFERLYATVTQLYFGGMARHLETLRVALRPGAHLAYVVGDQASYLQIKIPTGKLLADIAASLGYEVIRTDLFRTRFATATKEQLREEVVVLRWPERAPVTMHMNGASLIMESENNLPNEPDESETTSEDTSPPRTNRYQQIMERIFFWHYKEGDREVAFERDEMVRAARDLDIKLPKNLGDITYTFRYRGTLPASIRKKAPPDEDWIIRPAGRGRYKFVAATIVTITPNKMLAETKVPDSTPGVITMYALSDEQALLAKLRYNRLIDIFTGITCYSLQNHLRTTVPDMGQIETDEIYIGVDKRGAHYVIPVQAKGGSDRLGIIQIEQDVAMCASKFPALICRPIAAQFMEGELIALFEFEDNGDGKGVRIAREMHYRLVPPNEITPDELAAYRARFTDD